MGHKIASAHNAFHDLRLFVFNEVLDFDGNTLVVSFLTAYNNVIDLAPEEEEDE